MSVVTPNVNVSREGTMAGIDFQTHFHWVPYMNFFAITLRSQDVLFGRGAALNVHPGNKQFRSLVDSQRKDIANAKDRKQKRAIATLIYNAVLELHPPGRFLVQDQRLISPELNYASAAHSGSDVHPTLAKRTWVYVEPEKALAKILHRMRERDKEVEKEGGTQPERAVWDIYAQKSQLPSPAHQEPEDEKGDECNVEESDSQGVHSSSLLESIYLDDIQNQTAHQILSSAEDSKLQLDSDPSHQLREYTCRQWITSTKPEIDATSMQSSTEMTKYVKSALLVALKLTECIQEAEKDERRGHRNPIPLASIAPENLLIRTRQVQPPVGESTEAEETIEFAWMMSFVGDDSATGTVMSRLFSLGTVLYELFSMNEFIMDEDEMQPYHNMDSINISNDTESDYHTQKKIHRRSTQVDDEISHCVARLESNVVSWSLCALVKNLLECRHDPFCEDDAYASFEDLHADLQLMVDNPSCFLDNIHLSNNPKLEIPDKLYGRGEELSKLDDLFKRHIMGKVLSGAILSGEAGVGKSKLALYLQEQTYHCNGYFLSAKFEQHQMSLKPMSTIASMFDSLCELVFNDSSHSLLMEIDGELTSAIGTQPYLLGFIPNLRKLMPSCGRLETSNNCVDSAVSLRYLLGELLRVISSHSNLITIVIDDIQFADYASLLLVRNLLFSAKRTPVFFTLCHRDDESSMSVKFNAWLTSITMLALEPIKLESVTPRDVNQLVSEALHLSPRLTRSLSSVLHHKTRGNPLFLRQLLDSLTEQGYIYIDLKQHRWTWNLDAIVELEISESVIALLTDDIKRLPSDLQFGLQVAACIGSYVSESPLKYLSIDLGLDLKDILQQASQKGFMIDVADSTMFRFAHDKIQEAVYELMPDQQRRENHMRFGLGLCTQTLENKVDDEELFFPAVNQINKGGPTAVHDPSQKIVFAELNLQAGRRSIELSDYNTAVILFQHGISFLGDDAWKTNYQLTLELHDAAAESALNIHKLSMVSLYADCVVLNARCIDDKLLCKDTLLFYVSSLLTFLTSSHPIQVCAMLQKFSH